MNTRFLSSKFIDQLTRKIDLRNIENKKLSLYDIKKELLNAIYFEFYLKGNLNFKGKLVINGKQLYLNYNINLNEKNGKLEDKILININMFYFSLGTKVNIIKCNNKKIQLIFDFKEGDYEDFLIGDKILLNSFLLEFLKKDKREIINNFFEVLSNKDENKGDSSDNYLKLKNLNNSIKRVKKNIEKYKKLNISKQVFKERLKLFKLKIKDFIVNENSIKEKL